jgi:translocation and assembly module TamB
LTDKPAPPEPPMRTPKELKRLIRVLLVLVAVVVGLRALLISPPGHALVTAIANGQTIGRFGRLHVEGLHGDVLSNFSVDRATLSDAKGVWLDARGLKVSWSPLPILGRVFHADRVQASTVRVVRRPELAPAGPPKPMPLSVEVKSLSGQLELMEGFARQYGRWAVDGGLDLRRIGRQQGKLKAQSLTRPGDFLTLDFDTGVGPKGLTLALEAREAKGGSIAGALGYSPSEPFVAEARANGEDGRGSFHATASSGALTPLKADGSWTKDGGHAQGVVAFAGSDLFKPYMDRVGSQAGFDLAFQRRPDGRFWTNLSLAAENLAARGQGAVDAQPLGSKSGMRVSLSTPSASRLLGQKLAGRAAFDGTVTGTPADWRLAGTLSAEQAGVDGYALASLSGPAEARARDGRLDGQWSPQGSGGAGTGMVANLIGPRPKAQISASRLADGRVILDQLDLDGADLVVRGKGARGLVGGFSFEGQAEIPRVASLRPDGRGSLSARWRAAEAGRDRPWTLGFTAEGKGFASGLGQLDRLLGPSPRLKADGQFSKGVVRLEKAAITGQAGEARGQGSVNLNGALDLKIDWTARGPFEAGPVTIAGDARGSGRVSGKLLEPRVELASSFDRIDLPDLPLQHAEINLSFAKDPKGYDGAVAVKAQSAWGPAFAQSRFAFTKAGVRLDQLNLDAGGVKAEGSVALNRTGPSDADLSFVAGPGAFLTAGWAKGRIRLTEAAANGAELEATGANLAFRDSPLAIQSLRLSGRGTLARLPFTLNASAAEGQLPLTFDGSGLYQRIGQVATVSLSGAGKFRGAAYRTGSPFTVTLGPQERAVQADLTLGHGRLSARAHETKTGFDASANVSGVDVSAFNPRLVGQVDGTLAANGRGAQLSGTLQARLSNLRDNDAPEAGAITAEVRAQLSGQTLRIAATGRDSANGTGLLDVELPVAASAAPLRLAIARTQPIGGRFSVQGEARPYWSILVGGEDSLSGQISAQGDISGTLASPTIKGTANLSGGRLQDARTGLDLRNVTLAADFNHDAAVVHAFSAGDGHGGSISGQGQVDLARGGSSSFTLNLHRFTVLDRDETNARASGPLTLTRAADGKMKLAGKLRIDRAVISPNPPTPSGVVKLDVIEKNRPPGRGLDFAPPQSGPAVELDIALNAPGQVLVQGRGLNVELTLNARLGGTTRAPEMTGRATVIRGDFTFASKRFDFQPNGYVDLSTHVADMRLSLEAVYNPPTGGLIATAVVRGTAANPDITLTSTPSLPQDEILSQILFGASASQLSTAQAAQIGAATASLTTGAGLDVLSNLREFAGLDVLTFGAEGSALTVTGGKYVGNNLYLEVVGGGQGGTAVQADWRVLKNLSVVSQFTGQGYSKLSVFWRKDFH